MPKYLDYSDDDIRAAVASSTSLAQTLRKLNLKPAGGNYQTIKLKISRLGLNTDHFTGKAWNKGLFLKDSVRSKKSIKRRLLNQFGHKCQRCLLTEWNDAPIPLEIEHIDGNNLNNAMDNLDLLCCNCHAQTQTWRRRKR